MARPKRSDGDHRAVRSELVEAADITIRGFQYLRENGLWPFDESRRKEEGTAGLYSDESVAEIALVHGFMVGGFSLRAAALAADWFALDLGHSHDPLILSKSSHFGDWRRNPDFYKNGLATGLLSAPKTDAVYEKWDKPADGDIHLIVVDSKYLFRWTPKPRLRNHLDLVQKELGIREDTPEAFGWVEGLEGRADPKFTALSEVCVLERPFDRDGNVNNELTEYDFQVLAFQDALDSAISTTTINLSLTIRRVFYRIAEARM